MDDGRLRGGEGEGCNCLYPPGPFANSHLPWPRELTDTAPAGHNRSAAARQRHGLTVNREVDDVRSLDGLV